MVLKQQGQQRQSQNLQITPQLRHAIKLLELPNLELYSYLQELCLDNPLLKLEAPQEVSFESQFLPSTQQDKDEGYPSKPLEYESPLATPEKTLRQHTTEFIELVFTDPKEKLVSLYFLDHLDKNGYLRISLENTAQLLRCPEGWLETILQKLQAIEPTGLFARTLEECLSLQWKEKQWDLKPLTTFFLHHDIFLKGDFPKLQHLMEISSEEFKTFLKRLRECHPKPGQLFYDDHSDFITPDLIFQPTETGEIAIHLNERTHPFLSIDDQIHHAFKGHTAGYFKAKQSEASWLIKALQQRRQNLLKLGMCLIEHQAEFFKNGIMGLKPLTLKTVAEETGLHESTISRLTLQKFAATPFGVVNLKHFFSGAIKALSTQDEDISTVRVKNEMKKVIEEEVPQNPFSDDQLVFELAKKGINLSRRTITKYRESLNIPTSYERKRQAKRDLGLKISPPDIIC